MTKSKLFLIGGLNHTFESFINLYNSLSDSCETYSYTCKNASEVIPQNNSSTYVVATLGLKDIGLILELSKNYDYILINHDIGNDFDTKIAIKTLYNKSEIPVIILNSEDETLNYLASKI